MSRKTGRFYQNTPASTWIGPPPFSGTEIAVISVFENGGLDTLSPSSYSWDVKSGLIKIEFGIEEHTGYALYEYEDGSASESGITINCGCGSEDQEKSSANVNQQTDVKIAEASADVVMIDYKATSPYGDIETGRLVLIRKGALVSVDAERSYQDELLPLEFSAIILFDGVYLRISPEPGTSAVFSFTTKTL
jgi:hypothetical protein